MMFLQISTREDEMEKKIGEVTHFFAGPSAAVLRLSEPLVLGQRIHIVGATTDFSEKLTSMQINHSPVDTAKPGDDIAILVKDRVREGDEVFLVTAEPKSPKAKPKAKAKQKKKAKTKAKAKKPKAKSRSKPKAKAKAKKLKAKAKPKKAKLKAKKKRK
jgi:outer membrane biosynthesis protein TonB